MTDAAQPDRARVLAWLRRQVDPAITTVAVQRFGGGHSGGAWRVDVTGSEGADRTIVVKAQAQAGPVFHADVFAEGELLDALHGVGAPVPAVLARDAGAAVGMPCFAMEFVPGHCVNDATPGGYHEDPELLETSPGVRRKIWESFHDALAALHQVDVRKVPDTMLGRGGLSEVFAHWRAALLDVASADAVPRQLRAMNWLEDNLPVDAESHPAVCHGDARLTNAILEGSRVRTLLDFEVAYIGNPAADIGYSLMMDDLHRTSADAPLELPPAQEIWSRWSASTGRSIEDRNYWTAFAGMVLCTTATRAMTLWGLGGDQLETANPIVPSWESLIERAAS